MKTSLLTILTLLAVAALAFAAAPDGTWNIQGTVAGAPQRLVLTVSGSALTGTIDGVAITNGAAQLNTVHFQAVRNGVANLYKAVVADGKLILTEESPAGQATQFTYVHPANN
jgi:type 1 fimbria pilin